MSIPDQVAFYHSAKWLRTREAYISKVGGLCERCLKQGRVCSGYIVHHKIPINAENISDPSILLSFDNLEYLCLDCHNQEHYKTAKRWTLGADGSIEIKN